LRMSGKWQFPMYNEQLQEGVFLELTQLFSPRSNAPAYWHAQIDSFFNDQYQTNQMQVYFMLQEAEDWLEFWNLENQ
jgi:hypothetical protein